MTISSAPPKFQGIYDITRWQVPTGTAGQFSPASAKQIEGFKRLNDGHSIATSQGSSQWSLTEAFLSEDRMIFLADDEQGRDATAYRKEVDALKAERDNGLGFHTALMMKNTDGKGPVAKHHQLNQYYKVARELCGTFDYGLKMLNAEFAEKSKPAEAHMTRDSLAADRVSLLA